MPILPRLQEAKPYPRLWIGVDPGVGGSVALIRDMTDGPDRTTTHRLPEDDIEAIDLLAKLTSDWHCFAAIEKVSGWIGGNEGEHDGAPGSRMFTFGESYGRLKAILAALGIRPLNPRPQDWQKDLCPIPKGCKYAERKRLLKDRATILFPDVVVTLKNADALLLAEWCRRMN